MSLTITDPQEVKLIQAWRNAQAKHNGKYNAVMGNGNNPAFFLLVQAVPIGRKSYRILCRMVEEPLADTAVRDVERYR